MAKIPSKVQTRLVAGIKKYQPILRDAKQRGINESDTVFNIRDMLWEIFGYEKNSEITSEVEICGTYCDLATRIDGKIQILIEAKAINIQLKDNHVTQAVDYACKQPVNWVLLTNGITWQVHKVIFGKPVEHELILEIDFLALDHHEQADLEKLFLLTKESWPKSALSDYCEQKEALSKYSIAAVILSDAVLNAIRHELKQISPDVKIDFERMRSVLEKEVLNPEVVAGEKAEEAQKHLAKVTNHALKTKPVKESDDEIPSAPVPVQSASPSSAPANATLNQPPAGP